jgi:hypothetical protein
VPFKIFLSSVYMDSPEQGDEHHLTIRRRLWEYGQTHHSLTVWVAEYAAKGLDSASWFEIADTCIDNLRDSDVFIALLYRRGGNPIWLNEASGTTTASYFELELLHASLLGKPAFFFTIDGYEPEPALAQVIDLVRLSTTPSQWSHGTESEIESLIEDIAAHMAAVRAAGLTVNRFTDAVSDLRSFTDVETEIASTRISFLHGLEPVDRSSFSLSRVDVLLAALSDDNLGRAKNMAARLSRAWMAMRELAKVDMRDIDATIAQRWQAASAAWPSPASWLKMHGPLRAGVLAGLQSQQELRQRGYLADQAFPFGAYASEAYSIAKVSQTRRWQVRRLKAAVVLARRHAEAHSANPSGALAIKASATLQLARLGRPWLAFDALADYRAALSIRERLGASNFAIGEAMTEWAFAEYQVGRVLFWKRKQALARLAEGVGLLDSDDPLGHAGFVIRAKDKFAEALRAEGQDAAAEAQIRQADELARKAGIPRSP